MRFYNISYIFSLGLESPKMYEIFEQLCRGRGIKPYKVSKDTGVSQPTLSDWKRGISIPKLDKLQIIADYFGVSVDYLRGKTKERNGTRTVLHEIINIDIKNPATISDDGKDLIQKEINEIVSELNLGNQSKLLELARLYRDAERHTKEN